MVRVTYSKDMEEYYANADSGSELFAFWNDYAFWCLVVEDYMIREIGIDVKGNRWGI